MASMKPQGPVALSAIIKPQRLSGEFLDVPADVLVGVAVPSEGLADDLVAVVQAHRGDVARLEVARRQDPAAVHPEAERGGAVVECEVLVERALRVVAVLLAGTLGHVAADVVAVLERHDAERCAQARPAVDAVVEVAVADRRARQTSAAVRRADRGPGAGRGRSA